VIFFFGELVNRYWLLILVAWFALVVGLRCAAPEWDQVTRDGHFSFLPDDSASRCADELFNQAFPHDLRANSIVIVVARHSDRGLEENDFAFITDVLKPRLAAIADAASDQTGQVTKPNSRPTDAGPIVWRICSFDDEAIGSLLVSGDRRATLVILGLTGDFFARQNRPTVGAIEGLLDDLWQEGVVPSGLDLAPTGSAVVGRDIMRATENSARAIGRWTIVLVVFLAIVIFRAPLLALIPLITMYFAMDVALNSLALLADAGVIGLFKDIEAYSTVVVYASGIDYSLFLISRFQEELETGIGIKQGVCSAVARVGVAIAASAVTEVAGIGMMSFAEFRKFHEAGIAIAFSLVVMLLAVLTLTPALLRLAGRRAFWPHRLAARPNARPNAPPSAARENCSQMLWERIARAVLARPGTFWLISTAAMAPFAVVGVLCYNHLNYGLVGNLPRQAASAHGTKVLEQHFPAGATGPVNLLICNAHVDFRSREGFEAIAALTECLRAHRDELRIADIRSLATPWGATGAGREEAGGPIRRLFRAATVRRRALAYFVKSDETLGSHVTRLELALELDPFSEPAMDVLERLEASVGGMLPAALQSGSLVRFSGSTASLRDLRTVGGRDRTRTNLLVVVSVSVILVVLFRKVALTLYLMLTVVFSYLVTLGVTFTVFYLADREGFPGLDLTVPLFLFTVLIAVGADYNILLVTRVHEEEQHHGCERGVAVALARTGPIISSCGFIMAGTFLSLMIAGQLAPMTQLGFALAFGVLLDTFVIRPILVPGYLLLVHRGCCGSFGKRVRARE
jgi:RND superfamily putative drug exporter